jgi:hypothetical protein
MRKVLLALALLSLVGSAAAQGDNLDGGVLIAHASGTLYEFAGHDWCVEYTTMYGITDHTQQVNRIDTVGFMGRTVWYVVAGFYTDVEFCGLQFGLGDYNPSAWITLGHGYCPSDALSIPTAAWPGPNQGISLVATATPWNGNYQAVYWFGGYATGAETLIPIVPNPASGKLEFGNCAAQPALYDATGGGMGILMDGIYAEPTPPPEPDACCFEDGTCEMLLEDACIAAGGLPVIGEDCAVYVCPRLLQACCFGDGSCIEVLPDICENNGGIVYPDLFCDPNPCPPPPPPEAACCYPDGSCVITIEVDCDGVWYADEPSCEPNPCPQVPADNPTWGTIKSLYR